MANKGRGRIVLGGHTTPNRYFNGDEEVTAEEFHRLFPPRFAEGQLNEPAATQGASCWPQTSQALAVPIEDAAAYAEEARAKGVPTEFVVHPDGTCAMPKFGDRAHRARYHRAHGYHDNDAGYGDQSPK